jgi:hypothetical protein
MELINRAEWDSLKADPRFSKYREYQRLFLEFIKDQWADGNFLEELENAEASGKAQLLRDMVALDYDDIRKFFIEAGHIKETNSEQDIDDEG